MSEAGEAGGIQRDGSETGPMYTTAGGHEVSHVTLRVVDLEDDGFRVTEPGVSESATAETVHEAVVDYARVTGGLDD